MRTTRVALLALAMLGAAGLANAQCTASEPKLLLKSASDKTDPIAQCLSEVSLTISATCATSVNIDSLSEAAGTVRLQRLKMANAAIKRNAMDAVFPYIGDEAYGNCTAIVAALAPVTGSDAEAALGNLFTAVDGSLTWAATASAGQVTLTAGSLTLTYAVVAANLGGSAAPATGTDEDTIVVTDGSYAALVDDAADPKQYIAALCPAGTYSSRGGATKTIKTGCDTIEAGSATNKVGATSATDVDACVAGTYARAGAAQCLPCDVDTFAPYGKMPVCAECQDGYAPVQGSPRCFAGFSGRVLVTEGLDTAGTTVYDPNGVVIKIYGDDSSAVTAEAYNPGNTITFTTNQAPGVAAFGGALDGWAVVNLAVSTATPSLPFLDTCVVTGTTTAAVAVAEDVKSATLSMMGSTQCGQLNNKTIDISNLGSLTTFTNGTSNWQNLTLVYAAPGSLIAFGLDSDTASKVVVTVVGSSLSVIVQTAVLTTTPTGTSSRTATTVANSFGTYVQPTAPTCPAGTSYVEKADSAGVTYSRQCRPCPEGYYCPAGRAGFSPVATPCPAGTRATLFAQKLESSCSACAASYYQDTAGSSVCDFCGTALQGATTCPTTCPDGTEGDPRAVGGCTDCPAGTYRSGDMPACITCGTGSEVFKFLGANSTDDTAIDSRSVTGGQDCRPCEPGFYNDNSTVGVCSACAAGSYSPRGGQPSCILCPLGQWQNQTAAPTCKKAVKGTYINFVGATVNNVTCRAGYFGEVAGAVSEATGCKKCKPGSFSNTTAATFCNSCRTGFYQDKSAQTSCTQCPAGTINTAVGSSTCAICAPGSFSARGASTCTRCPVGTFQDRAKQSGCKPCPAGSFCPQAGLVASTKCPRGTYNPRPNGSAQRLACLPCAQSTVVGATRC